VYPELLPELLNSLPGEQYLDCCRSMGHNFKVVDSGAVMAQGPVAHLKNDENI